VLDSSATLAWIYSDEVTPSAQQLFERVADEGALVPALWRLEVANSLTVAVRRGRIDAAFRDAALRDLALLDIATDPQADLHVWTSTLQVADQYRLTVYDAAYLDLALRQTLPLASLDGELCAAAQQAGVELLLPAPFTHP
jgi:predicted nucleic acid-binding protein